jgi:hypothetical protein
MSKPRKKLNLVLTHHWYDETAAGRKRVEYRVTNNEWGAPSVWSERLWKQRHNLQQVTFSRGYTSTTQTFDIVKIDIGPCPIPGWPGLYFRIHFKDTGIPDGPEREIPVERGPP